MTSAPTNIGMESETMAYVNGLLAAHRAAEHPHHQMQVQKCPLRLCRWELHAWSLPGDEYAEDRTRLQTEWSKHMIDEHPTVRGPGTIAVTARLFPYDVPSNDDREIAHGALRPLRDGGVPIFAPAGEDWAAAAGLGEIVGQVQELREEDGWAVIDGFIREDLVPEAMRDQLLRGRDFPVSFAVAPRPYTIQGDRPYHVRDADLRELRIVDTDVRVWEGTGLRAVDPYLADEETPPGEGDTEHVALTALDTAALKDSIQAVTAALRPLQDALEAYAQALLPAVQAFAQALAEHAKNIRVQPEPIRISVADVDPDFLRGLGWPPGDAGRIVPGPGFEDRIRALSETVAGSRDWRHYVGVTTPPEGPEDWPRLPRDGKRAPTGCEVCEAPVDGRHPRHCPGA